MERCWALIAFQYTKTYKLRVKKRIRNSDNDKSKGQPDIDRNSNRFDNNPVLHSKKQMNDKYVFFNLCRKIFYFFIIKK